ncbi:MAG: DNA-binding domain-containing protein [Planctomycetaceae bacterium]|jgi:hypothetical protein|nr:DNA-binding domain-containing protein [Planctomycetaceae bacterium]MDG2391585.1 DNA-binding domain-containing protein [Planctomycetaceae bacterium]
MNEQTPRSLQSLQTWLQSVITHPNGVSAGILGAQDHITLTPEEIESVIPASSQLDPISKIEVYGNAYYARLIECLGDEYPAVKNALGAETFDSFAFSYLQQYPSKSYTLSDLGREFPGFLKQTKPADAGEFGWADFLIDLARLEWHYSEIFNGPGTETIDSLTLDKLQSLMPDQFAQCRLVPAPCIRLDEFRFPIHEYATAVRKKQESPPLPPPTLTRLVMTRRQYVVRRVSVSAAEYCILQELVNCTDESIGSILDRTAEHWADEMQEHLQAWFERWAAAGYFVGIEILPE